MECASIVFVPAAFVVIVWFFVSRRGKMIQYKGLPLFISGCDTGIGRYLATFFSMLGCDVYAGCLNPNVSRETLPGTVTVVPLDLRSSESVQKAVLQVKKSLAEKNKDLWALINNAGVCVYGEFEWQTWSQCQNQVDVNLLGTMRLTKAFLPLLRKMKGRIINITSVNGSIAYPGLSVYSATKFALEGFSNALRLELRRQHGIKVIVIQPGDLARLTSIMSQHRKNAEDMWEAMSEEDKEQFGDFFHMYHRVTWKNYGLTSPTSMEQCPLLQNVKDAVLNDKPKNKYIAAAIKYRIFYQLMATMPSSFSDKILDTITDMLYKSDDGEI